MTAALFLAVVISCAGDPAPGTLNVAPPPPEPAVVQAVETGKVETGKVETAELETTEPDIERPRRPRAETTRRILLEMLVVALEVVINH